MASRTVAQLRGQSTHRRFRRRTACKNAFRRPVPSSKRANELRAPLKLPEGPPTARANPIPIHVPSAESHLRSGALARKTAASSIYGELFLGGYYVFLDAWSVRVGQIRSILIRLIEHFSSQEETFRTFLNQPPDNPIISVGEAL